MLFVGRTTVRRAWSSLLRGVLNGMQPEGSQVLLSSRLLVRVAISQAYSELMDNNMKMTVSSRKSSRNQSCRRWRHLLRRISTICPQRSAPMYVSHSLFEARLLIISQRPTLLAKIFGCYKITFKKTQKDRGNKSKSFQMNLLVMENLFYDRQFHKVLTQSESRSGTY